MQSIQVNLRLSIRAAIGCGQLLIKRDTDTRNLPISTVVRSTMQSLINWLEDEGEIDSLKDRSDEELIEMYKKMFAADPPGMEAPESGLNFDKLAVELDDEKIEDIVGQVTERIESAVAPEPEVRTTTEEIETVDIKDSIDLFKVNRMKMAALSKIAPEDVLIKEATKGLEDPVFIAAVECVYTSIPPEMWGTSTAQQNVKDMMARHKEIKDG